MAIQTGISSNLATRYLIGPGKLYIDYGESGQRLLGATSGGSTFEPGITTALVKADGAYGPVKGLRRIVRVEPKMTVNLLEQTKTNLLLAIPGGDETSTPKNVTVTKESVGVGDGTTVAFDLNHGGVVASSYTVYVDDTAKTESTDYTLSVGVAGGTVGTVTFTTAPTTSQIITVTYTYDSGDTATHDTITLGAIADADYCTNITLVGEVAGQTYAGIFIVKNGIADGSWSLNLTDVDAEGVTPLVILGHFTSSALTIADSPFEIRWPRS